MPDSKRPLKVFLCHASTDKPKVRELYRYLKKRGIQPWFDEEDLVGGQDWQVEIPKALATSDAIIICLTKNSVDKEGYIQKEIKFALDKALEMPEGRIFLIPVKFEECEVPFTLSRYQWVDLTIESGYAKMMKALKFRASQLERSTVEVSRKDVEEENLVREKKEREAAEKIAHEKAEKDAVEEARLESEEIARQKAIKEKPDREATEKAKQEKTERQAARKVVIKKAFAKAMPSLRIVTVICIIAGLLWTGSLVIPKFISLVPTLKATSTQRPTASITSTKTPVASTKTTEPKPTPTKTRLPAPTPTLGVGSTMMGKEGMTLLYVPVGDFLMGTGESWNHPNEIFHTVYLEAFWIDKTEVTNKMYALCVAEGICQEPGNTSSSTLSNYYGNPQYDNHPVIYVNWNKAKTYCEWAGRQLPTEAQWEKAARGTDVSKGYVGDYPWKDYTIDCSFANYNKVCIGDTTEVGKYSKGASPYGALDMAGNVWEWVADWYSATYYTSSPASNPLGPSSGQYRVLRGGSWNTYFVSTSYRSWYNPAFSGDNVGFRCASTVSP